MPKSLQFGGSIVEDGFNAIVGYKQKYPGEHHLNGYSYLGPGTRLDIRLNGNTPKPGEEPINDLDNVALRHDIAYRDAGQQYDRTKDKKQFNSSIHKADGEFIQKARRSADAPTTGVLVSELMEKKKNLEILGLLPTQKFSGRGLYAIRSNKLQHSNLEATKRNRNKKIQHLEITDVQSYKEAINKKLRKKLPKYVELALQK